MMVRSVATFWLTAAAACVGNAPLISAAPDATCAAREGHTLRWLRAAPANEAGSLDEWCAGVGPPLRVSRLGARETNRGLFAVVAWNTHVGAGDIEALTADLRAGRLTGGQPVGEFVLLLQETYRAGAEVPAGTRGHMRWAAAERPAWPGGRREDIDAAARRLALDAVYVPSMRNGSPGSTDEDRGNAILSTLPLADVTAIELPVERQRRVVIEATVRPAVQGMSGTAIRVVSAHFTNMVMHHLWVLSESGRLRQARALARVLPSEGPLVVGGDFNAWFGYHDAAYRELKEIAAPAQQEDRRATFGPMRLDHVLFRLPQAWKTTLRRADSRYGSDHYPLIAVIEAPG